MYQIPSGGLAFTCTCCTCSAVLSQTLDHAQIMLKYAQNDQQCWHKFSMLRMGINAENNDGIMSIGLGSRCDEDAATDPLSCPGYKGDLPTYFPSRPLQ